MIVNFKMEVKTWLNSLLQMVTFVKKARRLRVSQGDTLQGSLYVTTAFM